MAAYGRALGVIRRPHNVASFAAHHLHAYNVYLEAPFGTSWHGDVG